METRKMVLAAILTAISVVIDTTFKLVIPTQLIGVPFYAIPIVIGAIILGVKYSVIIAILGDIISVLLAPGVAMLPLFTLSALMWGLIPGLFLYKHEGSLLRIIIIVLIAHLIVTSLNSFALFIHFHRSIEGLLVDLPLRLLLIIPNTIIISATTKAILEPVKPILETKFYNVTKQK